jgi:hypothetical protein
MPMFDGLGQAQRRVLAGILACVLVVLVIQLFRYRAIVPHPHPPLGARSFEVEDRMDPNVADAATLAALPLLGPKRAQDIVAFRASFAQIHPDRPAFRTPSDLKQVRGIGDATIAQIERFLRFPNSTSASKPASQPLDVSP